jgi:hypothetical protein
MFKQIYGYPISKATNETIYQLLTLCDDGYVEHNLLLEGIAEKERRVAKGLMTQERPIEGEVKKKLQTLIQLLADLSDDTNGHYCLTTDIFKNPPKHFTFHAVKVMVEDYLRQGKMYRHLTD